MKRQVHESKLSGPYQGYRSNKDALVMRGKKKTSDI